MNDISKYEIVTIYRTGSHYLQDLISQYFNIKLVRAHELTQAPVFTIVRDPLDTVASAICMSAYEFGALSINPNFYKITNVYENLSRDLLNHDSIFIKYEDLILYPDKIMQKIANIFDIEYKDIKYQNNLSDEGAGHILISSNKNFYETARTFAKSMDLSKLYDVYYKLVKECIEIN